LQGSRSAHYVLEKPVDVRELKATVQRALDECGLDEAVRALRSLERAEKIEHNDPERRFTERLARQNALLKRLRGAEGKPNITHLAGEFGVSRKTVLRDLHDLIQRGQLDAGVYPEWKAEQ
jgi:DNA-binding NtrC family response regulator